MQKTSTSLAVFFAIPFMRPKQKKPIVFNNNESTEARSAFRSEPVK